MELKISRKEKKGLLRQNLVSEITIQFSAEEKAYLKKAGLLTYALYSKDRDGVPIMSTLDMWPEYTAEMFFARPQTVTTHSTEMAATIEAVFIKHAKDLNTRLKNGVQFQGGSTVHIDLDE